MTGLLLQTVKVGSCMQVELQPGEPGREGTSCVVSAANNNVAKLRKGIAAFREVSFSDLLSSVRHRSLHFHH